jgi:hypothetical protein
MEMPGQPLPSQILPGQRFGRLVVIEAGRDSQRHRVWRCRCDCGKTVIKQEYHLLAGAIRSCGCLARESRRERALAFWQQVRGNSG